MKLSRTELNAGFYKRISQEFPELNEQQIVEICDTPFKLVRRELENGSFTVIRLQFFGTFYPILGRVKNFYSKLEDKFKEGIITEKYYNKQKVAITNLINKLKDEE